MNSTSFRDLISPVGVGLPHHAQGGSAHPQQAQNQQLNQQPHHLTVIVPIMPHPIVGALMHAVLLHKLRQKQLAEHQAMLAAHHAQQRGGGQ